MTLEAPVLMQPTGGDPDIDYSAQQLRTLADALVAVEGVFGGTHMAVAQRGAGANYSVDIAAGLAAVLGDDVSNQGKYIVRNNATFNTNGTSGTWAAPASSTRYDLVYLQIRDKAHVGGTHYDAVFDKALGTLGAGVPPALPASAIALAVVGPLTSGTASITNAIITDARPKAGDAAPTWTTLTGFAAGASASTPAPQWTKDSTGLVRLRGTVVATTSFAPSGVVIIAALPAAIVPSGDRWFPAATNFSSANHPARHEISAAGALTFFCSTADTIGSFRLDGITYHVT